MLLFRLILGLPALAIAAAALIAWFGLDDAPMLQKRGGIGTSDIASAVRLVEQLDPRAAVPGRKVTVSATVDEINAALRLALAGSPGVSSRVVVSRFGLQAAISGEAPLPPNPFGRYVNVRFLIEPSTDGLRIGRLAVGDIEVPRPLIDPTLSLLVDWADSSGIADDIRMSVRSVQVSRNRVRIVLQPRVRSTGRRV